MKPRILLIGIAAVVLAGCGQDNSAVVGSWVAMVGDARQTLKLNADSSYTFDGTIPMKGSWFLAGHDLTLRKDISNGGDVGFGDGGDGSYHFILSADGKTLTTAGSGAQHTTLVKQ